MTHSRWEGLRPLPDPHGYEVQLAYVDGYILALEDMLRDLKRMEQSWPATDRANYRIAVGNVRRKVNETLESARGTLKELQRLKKEGE